MVSRRLKNREPNVRIRLRFTLAARSVDFLRGSYRRSSSLLLAAVVAVSLAVALIGCGGTVHPALSSHPSPTVNLSFPNTSSNIHLGLAFAYRAHAANRVAGEVDYIFGGYFVDWNTGLDPRVKHIDAYLPFDTDAYAQSVPGHSLRAWQATHPDWIVYQCDRATPAYYGSGNTNVPLDFSNPAVRAYEEREAAAMLIKGARGVAFDDFTFANYENRCGVYRNGVWTLLGYPPRWQQNAKYDNDMMAWLRNIRQELRQRLPTKTLTVNMNLLVSGGDHLQEVTPYVDMVFDESGFTANGSRNLSDSAWQHEVDDLEYLNSQGRAFDVNGIVDGPTDAGVTQAQINWVLANYLLVKGSHSYTYIYAGNRAGFTGSPSGYGEFYDHPEYHIPIGHPTSDRFRSSGVQVRDYSGGLVAVNPSGSQTYTVPLSEPYRDMAGHRYTTSVTLAPTTAIVLLNTP